jgi:hypothetical protein
MGTLSSSINGVKCAGRKRYFSAKGAECNSLAQGARFKATKEPSAEGAKSRRQIFRTVHSLLHFISRLQRFLI